MRTVVWGGLVLASSVVSALVAHQLSRAHYLQLGMSYGSIDARVAVLREIEAALPGIRLCAESEYKDWKEIVVVKSGAIYVSPVDGTTVLVCIAR